MLVLSARAKLNLALEVTGRRDDGFHSLRSVVVALDWHDLVGVRLGQGSAPRIELRVTGSGATPDIPVGPTNLAHMAAVAFMATQDRPAVVEIWVDKHLPSAAGLGGGSTDAAAVVRALSILRGKVPVPEPDLFALAAHLGSDVPASLHGGCVLVSGRGEHVESLPFSRPLHLAVVVAGRSSTAATYAALTDDERTGDGRAERVADALRAGTHPAPDDLGSALEKAAIRCNPALGHALDRLRAGLPDGRWYLTGSGGAAFALTPTAAAARALAGRARAMGLVARACQTVG